MSEIDWSKAPEGTNYRDAGGNWLKFKNNQWFAWSCASGGYWSAIGKKNLQKPLTQKIVSTVADLLDIGYLVSPTLHMQFVGRVKRKPEWTGEVLPPVGTVCEFDGGTHAQEDLFDKDLKVGMRLTVIAHVQDGDNHMAVFTFNPGNPDRGNIAIEMGMHGCFRPIRTPDQIAAAERLHEVRNALSAIHASQLQAIGDSLVVAAVEAMIDAGYRKQEPK